MMVSKGDTTMCGILSLFQLFIMFIHLAYSSGDNVTDSSLSNQFSERHALDGDYLGCYPQTCFVVLYHPTLSEVTPDSCTATCKEYGYLIGAVFNRTECSCFCELLNACQRERLKDIYCGLPCSGANHFNILCGGYKGASVYYVIHSGNASNIKCRKNNTAKPKGDKGLSSTHSPRPLAHIAIAVSIAAAFFLTINIVAVLGVLIYRRRRNRDPHTNMMPFNTHRCGCSEDRRDKKASDLNDEDIPVTTTSPRQTPNTSPRHHGRTSRSSGLHSVTIPVGGVLSDAPDLAATTADSELSSGYLVPTAQLAPLRDRYTDHHYHCPSLDDRDLVYVGPMSSGKDEVG